jgi:transcription termination factor Rho
MSTLVKNKRDAAKHVTPEAARVAEKPAEPAQASGILKRGKTGAVLVNAVAPAQGQVSVPGHLVQQFALVEGATVTGIVRQGRQGRELSTVDTVCGLTPEAYRARPQFTELTAIDPSERFNLGAGGDIGMRAVDLLAPIGKGTRGLIVAPPKAGKTTVLEQVARGIRANEPDARIVVLLIDERPEELTYFRRNVSAEVFASSTDQSPAEHTALNELMIAHIRTELECGNEVVVLLDSLTRLTRAYNQRTTGASRTLSGGIDASALQIPRKFLGLARNVENGGSVTILATVLIDTGSRQDQLIYEEFKSTGNCEIVLDRELAQARLFPAINVQRTGTRKEERLYSAAEMTGLISLRRTLARYPTQEALTRLFELLAEYPTNEDLLRHMPAGGSTRSRR